ncbi:MAG: 50S ribosomal protein L9 [Ignavibacteria bacterium]|nr:50S ribosomal protein L9 [Ignavibacteria bacterium]
MKVILNQDHELLGDEGQIVEVKKGYARNYLIPNGIAASATKSNLTSFEEIRRQRSRKIQKLAEEAKKIAGDLTDVEVDIFVKTGEDDRIFGSVTSQMIFEALHNKGFTTIEKKKILLKEAIKTLGQHFVDVKLHQSVIAQIKVNVLDENAKNEVSNEINENALQDSEVKSE